MLDLRSFAIAAVFLGVRVHSDDSCTSHITEDQGLSLLQTRASKTGSNLNSTEAEEEAYVLIMRHAEMCHGGSLAPIGVLRADYLARCMSSPLGSRALPLGPPDSIIIGPKCGGDMVASDWPQETAEPLGRKLGLSTKRSCTEIGLWSPKKPQCIAAKVRSELVHKRTVVVTWVHHLLGEVLDELAGHELAKEYGAWPATCKNYFKEPACVMKALSYEVVYSSCYDAFFQIRFTRSNAQQEWKAQSVKLMNEGFRGERTSPCSDDLAPL